MAQNILKHSALAPDDRAPIFCAAPVVRNSKASIRSQGVGKAIPRDNNDDQATAGSPANKFSPVGRAQVVVDNNPDVPVAGINSFSSGVHAKLPGKKYVSSPNLTGATPAVNLFSEDIEHVVSIFPREAHYPSGGKKFISPPEADHSVIEFNPQISVKTPGKKTICRSAFKRNLRRKTRFATDPSSRKSARAPALRRQ